ncbi:hypothetical protein FPCIR_11395 [Fusarium pseudocircinatum]|uniref:Uncharacterized protein n=1 Tax=Fusarium pseudocircinatum TaxID=56676 RepID=A0A8H5KT39_9HYPO|nr:hypothetical protein FPCIR_11395 [Fusarium pseudocircinatum]
MHTHAADQWPQVSGEEQWQQQTVHFFTLMREMEIFQPAHELAHRRRAKKRKQSVTERDPQQCLPLPKRLHKRRGLSTGTFYNAR